MDRDNRIEIEPAVGAAAEKVADLEGTMNRFVNDAVLDRLRRADPATYWEARAARGRCGAFLELPDRAGDGPPIPGDEIDGEPARS